MATDSQDESCRCGEAGLLSPTTKSLQMSLLRWSPVLYFPQWGLSNQDRERWQTMLAICTVGRAKSASSRTEAALGAVDRPPVLRCGIGIAGRETQRRCRCAKIRCASGDLDALMHSTKKTNSLALGLPTTLRDAVQRCPGISFCWKPYARGVTPHPSVFAGLLKALWRDVACVRGSPFSAVTRMLQ